MWRDWGSPWDSWLRRNKENPWLLLLILPSTSENVCCGSCSWWFDEGRAGGIKFEFGSCLGVFIVVVLIQKLPDIEPGLGRLDALRWSLNFKPSLKFAKSSRITVERTGAINCFKFHILIGRRRHSSPWWWGLGYVWWEVKEWQDTGEKEDVGDAGKHMKEKKMKPKEK